MVVKIVLPFFFSVARKCARSTYRCVLTLNNWPRALDWTQPVELFGRIGRRTRYQVFVFVTSVWARTRTMLCVPSVVIVSSFVTWCDDALGCEYTGTRFSTCAQCATLSVVSFVVSG